ncbi:hypothetical protein T459_06239 [Capsicum annuum]|uniref:Uncharacterized protein n=1 Tax=Capsicum annuum TaxID=4072 RepID=A0A2G3AA49_CAPAN|nr:hypothetical protein T459_06239 [Capsicum annuum]
MGLELNTNGSFIKVIGKAGAGGIVRKRNGQMIMVFVAPIQFCTNNYFEARAALIGKIPREFGNLSFLVSLDMGSNNFHGNLPQEMAQFALA